MPNYDQSSLLMKLLQEQQVKQQQAALPPQMPPPVGVPEAQQEPVAPPAIAPQPEPEPVQQPVSPMVEQQPTLPQRPKDFLDMIGIPAENREQALRAVTDIAEGMGNFRVTTPGHVMFKYPVNPPMQAEGTRNLLEEEKNRLKPDESEFYNRALRTDMFQPGMDTSRIDKFLGPITSLQRSDTAADIAAYNAARAQSNADRTFGATQEYRKDLSGHRKTMEDISERSLGERVEGRKEREGLKRERFDFAKDKFRLQYELHKKEFGRLPKGAADNLNASLRTLDSLKEVEDLYDRAKDREVTGPVFGRIQRELAKIGTADKTYLQIAAALTRSLGSFLKQETGAQRGMQEVAWLAKAFPDIVMNAENFEAMLENVKNKTLRDLNLSETIYKSMSYNAAPFEAGKAQVGVQAPAAATGGGITIVFPQDGSELSNLTQEEADQILKDVPGAQIKE